MSADSKTKNKKTPRICMCVFSYYPADARVRREAEALVEAGIQVDVVSLRQEDQKKKETVNGVGVYRLPVKRKRGGKLRYMWEYFAFILLSLFKITGLHLGKRYQIVHVHNMPDVLIYCALFPRLLGAKAILDLHDPMPEVFMTKYDMNYDHKAIRLLRFLEKLSIAFANQVLTPNIAFRNLFVRRSCPAEKIEIVMNAPQESIFEAALEKAQPRPDEGQVFRLMYHGTVVERHGLDTALEAVELLRDKIPGLCFEVYGEGDFVETFLEIRKEKKLEDIVHYHGFVTMETIADAIPHIDIGLIPNKRSTFTEINLPTRILEYLSMKKPVIAPRTQGILDYFEEDSLYWFEPGNAQSLSEAILRAWENPDEKDKVLKKGRAIYEKHRWSREKERLIGIVSPLLER
ncbi:MAG: glycosyltransferase family 4 protein [Candidatus Sumerlaeia bacterium]